MSQQVLIIGLGQFGMSLARTLTEKGAEVLAVDRDKPFVEEAAAFVTEALTIDATDEAELAGNAHVRPGSEPGPGGQADLRLTAPGTQAQLKGELQPNTGAGTLLVQLQDAARALAWAQKLPGASDVFPTPSSLPPSSTSSRVWPPPASSRLR